MFNFEYLSNGVPEGLGQRTKVLGIDKLRLTAKSNQKSIRAILRNFEKSDFFAF